MCIKEVADRYSKVNLNQIVDLILLINRYYGDDFITLEEVDMITYPYELFILFINKLPVSKKQLVFLKATDSRLGIISYLFLNLDRTCLSIMLTKATFKDYNVRMFLNSN